MNVRDQMHIRSKQACRVVTSSQVHGAYRLQGTPNSGQWLKLRHDQGRLLRPLNKEHILTNAQAVNRSILRGRGLFDHPVERGGGQDGCGVQIILFRAEV